MTDLIETIRRTLVPIHKEGYPFIGIFALMLGLFGFFVKFLAWTVGLGAVLLAGLDRRSARRSENGGGTPAPSLPPTPERDAEALEPSEEPAPTGRRGSSSSTAVAV